MASMHSFCPEVSLTPSLRHAGHFHHFLYCLLFPTSPPPSLCSWSQLSLSVSLLLPHIKATKSDFFCLDCAFVRPPSLHLVSTFTSHPRAGALSPGGRWHQSLEKVALFLLSTPVCFPARDKNRLKQILFAFCHFPFQKAGVISHPSLH